MRAEERARAKEAQAMMELKKDAGKRVNLSYNKFAGNEDVGAFMRSLGYSNYTIEVCEGNTYSVLFFVSLTRTTTD